MQPRSRQLSAEFLDAAVELMGRAGRRGTVRVRGRSMLPTLVEGQILAVEFSFERLATGDMLVFRKDEHLVVHRLVGRCRLPDHRPGLRLRGDGVMSFDPPVEPSQVVARVVALLDDDLWRSTRHGRSRLYARCLAWHDLFWGFKGVVGGYAERTLARVGLRPPFRAWVSGVDRRLLKFAHRLLFGWAHPVIQAPLGSDEVPSDAGE